ncbi:MAG: molybdenum cofactor guanylyltransferase MobA [Alphaproteobacteria bacterium]
MTKQKKLAVILAGGLSSRMGKEKSFLRINQQKYLIDHVIDIIKPQVDMVAINANGDKARFSHTALTILPDDHLINHNVGPLLGVLTAMRWAKKMGGQTILTLSCDCPQLPNDLYEKLAMAKQHHIIVVAKSFHQPHPTIALWQVDMIDDLTTAIKNGVRKIDNFTANYKTTSVDFTTHRKIDDPFLNLNTPEEFQSWLMNI